jgi:hypothetical protein
MYNYITDEINEDVKDLIETTKADGIEIDEELLTTWISDIIDDINPEDIGTVTRYLLKNEKSIDNLTKAYSFVNTQFEAKMDEFRNQSK